MFSIYEFSLVNAIFNKDWIKANRNGGLGTVKNNIC